MFICVLVFLLFCKQKKAYEIRISDWSSDVCSSDLAIALWAGTALVVWAGAVLASVLAGEPRAIAFGDAARAVFSLPGHLSEPASAWSEPLRSALPGPILYWSAQLAVVGAASLLRSEEHTSELQSLMRISYAVFCLKKKNK